MLTTGDSTLWHYCTPTREYRVRGSTKAHSNWDWHKLNKCIQPGWKYMIVSVIRSDLITYNNNDKYIRFDIANGSVLQALCLTQILRGRIESESQFNAANSFFPGFKKWFWILNSKQWPIRKQMKEEDTVWSYSGVTVLWFYIVIQCRVYDRNQGSQHCEGYSLSNVGYFFLTLHLFTQCGQNWALKSNVWLQKYSLYLSIISS